MPLLIIISLMIYGGIKLTLTILGLYVILMLS